MSSEAGILNPPNNLPDWVVEGEDLIPVNDTAMEELLWQVIKLGQQFRKNMNRSGFEKMCAVGDIGGIRMMLSSMRQSGEAFLRPILSEKFPKHAIFFSHGDQAKNGNRQLVLSSETFLIHLAGNNSDAAAGKDLDPNIYIAVLRGSHPEHGICHYSRSGVSAMTRNGAAHTHNNPSPDKLDGRFENVPLQIRDFYRKNGFPEELRMLRDPSFFTNTVTENRASVTQAVSTQFLDVAAGWADFTDVVEARLIEIAASHAVLLKSGGDIVVSGSENLDYRRPFKTVKCVAMDTGRIEHMYKKATSSDAEAKSELPHLAV